jgi:hypothetical protein
LVCKVREHPFVKGVGRSGSGKSSLVYPGLLSALRRERDPVLERAVLAAGASPAASKQVPKQIVQARWRQKNSCESPAAPLGTGRT